MPIALTDRDCQSYITSTQLYSILFTLLYMGVVQGGWFILFFLLEPVRGAIATVAFPYGRGLLAGRGGWGGLAGRALRP